MANPLKITVALILNNVNNNNKDHKNWPQKRNFHLLPWEWEAETAISRIGMFVCASNRYHLRIVPKFALYIRSEIWRQTPRHSLTFRTYHQSSYPKILTNSYSEKFGYLSTKKSVVEPVLVPLALAKTNSLLQMLSWLIHTIFR